MSWATPPLTELTSEGEQMLIPGVAPVSLRQRLEFHWTAPLAPKVGQKSLDFGLFDLDARRQLDLFQPAPMGRK